MMDDLYAGVLLIVESAGECIAEYQHINTLSLKILLVIKLERTRRPGGFVTSGYNNSRTKHKDSFLHKFSN